MGSRYEAPRHRAIIVEPLWQVKAWLKKIPGASFAKLMRELLSDIKADTAQRARVRHKPLRLPDEEAYCARNRHL
jgi:hypothetical protein